jgi:NitT/TauT family transport system substrate-binding protein
MLAHLARLTRLALPVVVAALSIAGASQVQAQDKAQDKVLRVGTLKLIHGISVYFYDKFVPAGYTVEVFPFESPTDGKNAVLTGTVDTCIHGIAAFLLGAAAGEPVTIVANANNGGMAVIAGVKTDIKTIKDLKGKKVAIWPGSTQEAVILERLRMEGMSIKDIQPIRLSFSDHPAALARGDIDAYVGAEPAPALSITSGVGQLVEYPYGTAMGGLNMIFGTHEDTVAKNPDLVRAMLKLQRQAAEYMMANKPAVVDATVQKLGANRAAVEQALGANNVEYVWKLDGTVQGQAKTYAQHMLELKQIRALPKFETFLNPKFSDEIAGS